MVEDISLSLIENTRQLGVLTGQWLDKHLINVIAIIVGAWLVHKFGAKLIARLLKHTVRPDLYPTKADREKRLKTLNSLISAFTKFSVYLIALFLIIGELNPSYTAALFASAGLITVALGFGAQSLIKDFVSGIFIISENQYRVGDIVEIAGVGGVVEDVTIRTTVLRDLSGFVYHIPNGTIDVTTNKTIGYSRINEDMVVSFDADIDRVEHIVNHVGEELAAAPDFKSVIKEAPRFATVKGYAINGLVVNVLATTTPGEQWRVRSEMYRRLKKAFDKADIEVSNLPVGIAPQPVRRKKK